MRNQKRFYPKFRFPLFLNIFLMVLFSFTLVYGATSNLVRVPNVIGASKENASRALAGVGLGVAATNLPVDDPKYNNTVKLQSVQPGNMVAKGTMVTITVLQYKR